jgi:flagellar basal-body rod protein FlgG
LVNMIETQRAYEMNSKAIATSDEMLQYINNNI